MARAGPPRRPPRRLGSRAALAPGLTDDEALVAALEWDARRQNPDPARLAAVVATYERLGRVQGRLAFLQARAGDSGPAAVLEALEQLAERAGEIDSPSPPSAASKPASAPTRAGPSGSSPS